MMPVKFKLKSNIDNSYINFNYDDKSNIYFRLFRRLCGKLGNWETRGYRERLVKKYSFAIPSMSILKELCSYSPLVEVGAGTGYWSYLIKKCGGNIIAYDNYSWMDKGCFSHRYFDVKRKKVKAIMSTPSTHKKTLFLCWPDYKTNFAYECIQNFHGKYFIYIGESESGCTGNDRFFRLLNRKFKLIEEIEINNWWGINDQVYIYKRNGHQ